MSTGVIVCESYGHLVCDILPRLFSEISSVGAYYTYDLPPDANWKCDYNQKQNYVLYLINGSKIYCRFLTSFAFLHGITADWCFSFVDQNQLNTNQLQRISEVIPSGNVVFA